MNPITERIGHKWALIDETLDIMLLIGVREKWYL
jgi:hypothetical protein